MDVVETRPSLKILLPGSFVLAAAAIATVVLGFYIGFATENDATLKVMTSMFVYPSPYVLFALLGGALYHTKRWWPLGVTFNIGATILLVEWLLNVIVFLDPKPGLQVAMEQALETNFLIAASTSVLFVIVMIVEGQIAWPGQSLGREK